MPELIYTSVTWTAGDIITEAKMDNMVANDRAVDAMNNGIRLTERADPSAPPANTIHFYAKDKAGTSAMYAIDDSGTIFQISETTPIFTFPVAGGLLTGTNILNALVVPKALTITKVYAYVKTAPTGQSLIADIKKNGSSIWNSTPSNRITILPRASSGSQTNFDTVALAEGDVITLDIAQIGSLVAGSDLTIEIKTK